MPVSQDLLDILACPACKTPVTLEASEGREELVCADCGRRYPIREDIPVMLIEEGEKGREEHQARLGGAPSG